MKTDVHRAVFACSRQFCAQELNKTVTLSPEFIDCALPTDLILWRSRTAPEPRANMAETTTAVATEEVSVTLQDNAR